MSGTACHKAPWFCGALVKIAATLASDATAAGAATAPERSLAVHRVSPDVNRVACDDPRLIEPVTGAAAQPDFLGDLLG